MFYCCFVVVYVSLRVKIMPVAMLNILAAKTMKPEYCSLISFLVKASPLWKCQRYSFGCIYFNLVSFMLCVVRGVSEERDWIG